MKIRLTKQFEFAATHALTGMQEGHACAQEHGHDYVLQLTLEPKGSLSNGLVIDTGRLKVDVWPVIKRLANRNLNDLDDPAYVVQALAAQPTVENLALYFWQALEFLSQGKQFRLVKVRVYETPKLFAEVSA